MTHYALPDALPLEIIERLEELQERLSFKEFLLQPRRSKRPITPWTPVTVLKEDYNEQI